jgi:hypothetical protein
MIPHPDMVTIHIPKKEEEFKCSLNDVEKI